MKPTSSLSVWLLALTAAGAGALVPFSLAPYDLWPLGLLSIALLAMLCQGRTGRACLQLGFAYGLGLYGMGASWVYISISEFGATSAALAVVLTSAFVIGLALAFSLPLYLYGRFASSGRWALLLAFPAIWVLGEWMRSWFLTGFPWLYVGYGHIDTWLAGWAPTFGVFGVSLAVALSACALIQLGRDAYNRQWHGTVSWTAAGVLVSLWVVGAVLRIPTWTTLHDEPISLGMAQGNIPQERKWDPDFLPETYQIYGELSADLWKHDWVIWPEAAIPLLYHHALSDIHNLEEHAKKTNTVFITGILYDQPEPTRYFNSIIARGEGSGIAFKTRLVPFGEYVPLERWLRGTIEFFDLPTSIIHPGPAYEGGLRANDIIIAPSICYEVVYPDLVAARAAQANVLLTVSNDAWFGDSIGPVQHFQMAQMRALESGRYMVRSTNSGISGIIDRKGQVQVVGGRGTRESVSGEIYAADGQTPFTIWRSWPIVILSFGLFLFAARASHAWQKKRRDKVRR